MKAKELPQMTEQDQAFALEVHNQYKIPFDDLCRLIANVRNNIVDDFEKLKESSDRVQTFNKLFDPEIEIKGVNIITNKGTIEIDSSDRFYSCLKIPIQRIKDKFKADLKYLDDRLPKGAKAHSCNDVMKFIKATSLKPRHKEILAFEFIHYFKFHWDSKPTKTKKEWDANPTEAKNYPAYCRDIGKSRLQNL